MTVTGATLRLGTTTGFSTTATSITTRSSVPDGWDRGLSHLEHETGRRLHGDDPVHVRRSDAGRRLRRARVGPDRGESRLPRWGRRLLRPRRTTRSSPMSTRSPGRRSREPEPSRRALPQRIESERDGDDTLSIEIVNPCCGPELQRLLGAIPLQRERQPGAPADARPDARGRRRGRRPRRHDDGERGRGLVAPGDPRRERAGRRADDHLQHQRARGRSKVIAPTSPLPDITGPSRSTARLSPATSPRRTPRSSSSTGRISSRATVSPSRPVRAAQLCEPCR